MWAELHLILINGYGLTLSVENLETDGPLEWILYELSILSEIIINVFLLLLLFGSISNGFIK